MEITLKEIAELVNGGGNIATLVAVYFIFKAADRLARIEKALSKYMEDGSK